MAEQRRCFCSYVSVIQELVFNSIDAKATCVAIRLRTDPDFCVQVIDNGEGIPESVMSYVGLKCKVIELAKNQIPSQYGIDGRFLRDVVRDYCGMLEIVSRCGESERTLKKQLSFYRNICSLQWAREIRPSTGTTVSLKDLQLKGAEGLQQKSWEPIDLTELLLVVQGLSLLHPNISFSIHDTVTGDTVAAHRRQPLTKEAFQHLLPNSDGQLVDIHVTAGTLRLDGFIADHLVGQPEFQYVFLNKKLIQNTRIHRFINKHLLKNRQFVKETSTEKEAAYLIELFSPAFDFAADFHRQKTKIQFRDDKAVAKLLQKAIFSFFQTVNRQEKELSSVVQTGATQHRRPLGKVFIHWLTPRRQVDDGPMDDENAEIDLKMAKDSPKIQPVNYDSLSGSLSFIPDDRTDARSIREIGPSDVKRLKPRESSFQPKKKIRILPNNQIVIVDVKSDEERQDGQEQLLWVPGNEDRLDVEEEGHDRKEGTEAVPSIYFSKSKSGFPLHLIPATGKAEVWDMLKHWKNPFFEPPEKVIPESRSMIRIRPPKSSTFSKESCSATKVLNQVDNRFIVCLMPDVDGQLHVVLIDQHAAHERVRLEQLTKHYTTRDAGGNIVSVKTSDVDPVFEVSTPVISEARKESVLLFLRKCGLHLRISGPCTAQILAVPCCFLARGASEVKHGRTSPHAALVEELIREKCEEFESSRGGSTRPMSAVVRNILNSLACHGAIKFGDPLTVEECTQLMAALSRCDNPFQCAHGRPVITVLLDLKQLDRLEPPPPVKPRIGDLVRRFQQL